MDWNDIDELSNEGRIERAILKLPTLAAQDVPVEDSCPICLVAFSTILDAPDEDSGSTTIGDKTLSTAGVTKLDGCGHFFCRFDLIEWIRGFHGTCPACRHHFLELRPEREYEESSDGDYVPDDTDDEMDDLDDLDGLESDYYNTDDEGGEDEFWAPMEEEVMSERHTRMVEALRGGRWSAEEHGWRIMDDWNLGLSEGASESFSEASLVSGDEEVMEESDRAQVADIEESEASGSAQAEGSKD